MLTAGEFNTSGRCFASGGIQTNTQIWTLGTYTATVSSIIGYLTVTVNGTTRRIAVVS